PLQAPRAPVAHVLEAVVDVVLVLRPELVPLRHDAVAAPERRPGRIVGHGLEEREERLAALDRLALPEGDQLALALAPGPVTVVLLVGDRLDAPLDPRLPTVPQRDERGLRVGGELAAGRALRARPEREPALVDELEDDGARRRAPVGRGRRQHDRHLLRAPPLREEAQRVALRRSRSDPPRLRGASSPRAPAGSGAPGSAAPRTRARAPARSPPTRSSSAGLTSGRPPPPRPSSGTRSRRAHPTARRDRSTSSRSPSSSPRAPRRGSRSSCPRSSRRPPGSGRRSPSPPSPCAAASARDRRLPSPSAS